MPGDLNNSKLKSIIGNALCRVVFYTFLVTFSLYLVGKLLIPIMAGVIFATALLPVYNSKYFLKIKSPGRRSQVLVFLFLFACLIPATLAVYTGFMRSISVIEENEITFKSADVDKNSVYSLKTGVSDWLVTKPALENLLSHLPVERKDVVEITYKGILKSKDLLLDSARIALAQIPEFVVSLIIVLLTMYFFFIDKRNIKNWLSSLPLFRHIENEALQKTFSDVCNSIIYASVLSGIIQALIVATGALVVGFGNSLLLGMITFFCSFIPLIGAGIVSLGVLSFIVINGTWTQFFIFLVFGFIASISDNFIRPVVMRSKAKTHPLVTFVGAIAGVQLFGMYGLFIGPVWIATILKLLSIQQKRS